MIKGLISIGNKVELKKIKSRFDEKESDKVYKSKLLDFADDDNLNIAMPIEKGRIIPLDVGDIYSLVFYTEKGLYECKGIITDRYQNGNIYILEFKVTSEFEKYQRRQFYRISCVIELRYYIRTKEEMKIIKQNPVDNIQKPTNEENDSNQKSEESSVSNAWIQGIITDISGGGLRFLSQTHHELGENLKLEFMPSDKLFLLCAKVISSNKVLNKTGFFEHRVQYVDIIKEEREAIIKFIFEEDRRQRKKEKGLN